MYYGGNLDFVILYLVISNKVHISTVLDRPCTRTILERLITDGAHVTAIGDIFQISVMAVRIWSLYSENSCNSHYWYFQNLLLWEISPMTVTKSFLELQAQVTVITDKRCCQIKPKSDELPEISPMAVMKDRSLLSSHVTVITDIFPKDNIFAVFCYSHSWHLLKFQVHQMPLA